MTEPPDSDEMPEAENSDTLSNGQTALQRLADGREAGGMKKNPLRRKPRKLWPIAVACLFLVLGVVVASQIGSPGSDVEFNEMAVEQEVIPVVAGDDADRFGDSIVAMVSNAKVDNAEHPIDPLLALADEGFKRIDESIRDYTATIVSQVCISGKLRPEKRMECKIRHARTTETEEAPLSVYLRMLKPNKVKGQEVIWVEGENEGRLIAHTTGMMNVKRFLLDPRGIIAMKGNRHPIFEVGFKNLIAKMKSFGLKDREHGECEVTITRDVLVDNRPCTMIQVEHPIKRGHFSHHISKIYLDQGRDVLVGYEGFMWPEKPGEKPPLLERYFYVDMQINVGLTDEDFSPDNPEYDFPTW
jgi:hypothetical protein